MIRQMLAEPICPPIFESLEPRLFLSGDTAALLAAQADPVTAAVVAQDPATDLQQLVAGNNEFALDLYQQLRERSGNLFFSPFSISSALSMAYAGAANETARQMAEVLHLTLPQERLHEVFGQLISGLDSGDSSGSSDPIRDAFTLNIANSFWGRQGYPFDSEYLGTLATDYEAAVRQLDFQNDPEGSRAIINQWVSERTQGKIPELLKEGDITKYTALALVNAIYFNASWTNVFAKNATRGETFHLPGQDVRVDMMHQTEGAPYAEGDDYQAVELAYAGSSTSMVIFLPKAGQFDAFEQSFTAERMDEILDRLNWGREVSLHLPRFSSKCEISLPDALRNMGMVDAFAPDQADFSEMLMPSVRDDEGIVLNAVRHSAGIDVQEEKTEAYAATAVGGFMTTVWEDHSHPVTFNANRPFIYTIRDRSTNSTLFIGRVSDASAFAPSTAPAGAEEPTSDGPDAGRLPVFIIPSFPWLPKFPLPDGGDPAPPVLTEAVSAVDTAVVAAAPAPSILDDVSATDIPAAAGIFAGSAASQPPVNADVPAPALDMPLADAAIDVIRDTQPAAGGVATSLQNRPADQDAQPAPSGAESLALLAIDPLAALWVL